MPRLYNYLKDKASPVPRTAVGILFIYHVCCFISLVIACVLVMLQIVTVGSEQEDNWWFSVRQTLPWQAMKKAASALQLSLFLSSLSPSIYPSTNLSIHLALLSKVGQKKDLTWHLIPHSDEAACYRLINFSLCLSDTCTSIAPPCWTFPHFNTFLRITPLHFY